MKKIITYFFVAMAGVAQAQTLPTDKNAIIHSHLRVATTTETDASDATKAIINIQYFDGLGKSLQNVGYQQSPTGKDIVSGAVKYDNFSRITQTMLPTPTNNNSGAYIADPTNLAQTFYNSDTNPFSANTAFDNSPLNRVRKSYGAGQAWRTNSKKVQQFDEIAGSDIRYYYLNSAKDVVLSGTYPANSLSKKRVIDEQNHTSIEITDRTGRMIQKQVQDDIDFITTCYVYDDMNRLRAVIQPEGYKLNQSLNYNSTNWKNFVFYYEYDGRQRMILKKVPGADEEYFVYDQWNRVVISQTALQKESSKFTFYKYDLQNREIMRGEFTDGGTIQDVRNYVANTANITVRGETRNNIAPLYYTTNSYPFWLGANETNVVTYYDDYSNFVPSDMAFSAANVFGQTQYTNVKGMPVGSRSKNTENGNWLAAVSYFDYKGRAIQVFAHNVYGQTERTDFQYNFADLLQMRSLLKDATGNPTTKIEVFAYNNVGNPISYKVGINATPTEVACQYNYDEINRLDKKIFYPNKQYRQLPSNNDYIYRPPNPAPQTQDIAGKAIFLNAGTIIDGTNLTSYLAKITPNALSNTIVQGLQTINYNYHIRGMVNCINCNSGTPTLNNNENDIFANKLDFESQNYYDGNIGKQTWINKKDNKSRIYTYNYDAASRLLSAAFSGNGTENFGLQGITYDKNGNIQTLNRNGLKSNGYGVIDQLSYTYSGNRLQKVEDGVSGSYGGDFQNGNSGSDDYDYYGDGSLKKDLNKGISAILYDSFLKKIKEVDFSSGATIKFYFDGLGNKLKQVTSTGEELHYTSKAIYQKKNGVTSLLQISQNEGRIVQIGNNFVPDFVIKDHLGSLRASLRDSLPVTVNGVNLPPVLTNFTDYDAFGLELKTLSSQNPVNPNRFKWLDREDLTELNGVSDLVNRFYDRQIGRFWSVDAKADVGQQIRFSPYAYGFNNPVRFSDPDGLFGDIYDQKANKIGTDNKDDGKVYVVTDRQTVKDLRKSGGVVADAGAVNSAIELPSAFVRTEMGSAVDRSNARNDRRTDEFKGDDNEGGFHEEGGVYGTGSKGEDKVVAAKPGAKADPSVEGMATIQPSNPAISSPIAADGSFHVHPSGSRTASSNCIGCRGGSFNQSPTNPADYNEAKGYPKNSYVLGAGNGTVTIYNGNSTQPVATFPLPAFRKIGN
jgi:RHS repeat-associated protein